MIPRTLLLALAAPWLLAACTNETTIPLAGDSPGARSAPARSAAPAPAVTTFDGRYVGTLTLNPDRTRTCPPAPTQDRDIVVRQGRGTLTLNPQTRQLLTGTVGADGDIRMADSLDRTIATSGMFTADRFLGEHRNGPCTYAVRMSKRD